MKNIEYVYIILEVNDNDNVWVNSVSNKTLTENIYIYMCRPDWYFGRYIEETKAINSIWSDASQADGVYFR